MKAYIKLWKNLFSELNFKVILDAFFGALVFNLLLSVPLFIVMAQIISVYAYLVNLWVCVLMILAILLNYILHLWWNKALRLAEPNLEANTKKLFLVNQIITDMIIVIIGLLFIFVFIPIIVV
ncbi:MAG: hypothetical protein WCY80_02605 [Candidatus Izemoplasmatales bacterium]|jgi:hypothetical protein